MSRSSMKFCVAASMHGWRATPAGISAATELAAIEAANNAGPSGQNYNNPGVGAGSCVDHYEVGPVARPEHVEYMQAELQRIRGACNALSFDDDHGHRITMR